jgi:hypothetical protein
MDGCYVAWKQAGIGTHGEIVASGRFDIADIPFYD